MTAGFGRPYRPPNVNEVTLGAGGIQEALDTLSAGIAPGESRYTRVEAAGEEGDKEIVKLDNPDFMLAVTVDGDPDIVTDAHLANSKITLISRLTPRQNVAVLLGAIQRIAEVERQRGSKN
jgi:hypothetical protein